MKLAVLLLTLAVSCGSVTSRNAKTSTGTRNEELLKRAASQLERLSNFRRTREPLQTVVQVLPINNEHQTPRGEKTQTPEDIVEARKRIDELRASASELLRDPRYEAIMQDRIKRSFISGIADKLINGVTGASGGLSRGSSGAPTGYGYYGHAYESKFDIWDFKKAIINTLIQAIKAIGGTALAGGGALVKGGGFLVAAKGQIISSAGNAIASLGKSLASSAVIAGPGPVSAHPGYSYDHPPKHSSQTYNYDGPPPSADAYVGPEDAYNGNFAAPSNDDTADEQTGVLIVKETKHGHGHEDVHQVPASIEHQSKPSPSAPEESFAGPPNAGPVSTITKILGFLNSGQPSLTTHHTADGHVHFYSQHKDQPSSSHVSPDSVYQSGSPLHHQENDNHNSYQDYQSNGQIYDSYGTKLESSSSQLAGVNGDVHQSSNDHQSLAYQQIRGILNTHLDVPKLQEPTTFRDPSSYADYQYQGHQHQSEPVKIPIFDNQQNSLDNGLGGSLNYYGLPNYGSEADIGQPTIGLHADGSHLPIIPDYNNYPLQSGMGFGQHIQHPAVGGPTVLSVWGRMTRRTGGQGKKTSKSNKGLEIQRSIAYALKNSKLARI